MTNVGTLTDGIASDMTQTDGILLCEAAGKAPATSSSPAKRAQPEKRARPPVKKGSSSPKLVNNHGSSAATEGSSSNGVRKILASTWRISLKEVAAMNKMQVSPSSVAQEEPSVCLTRVEEAMRQVKGPALDYLLKTPLEMSGLEALTSAVQQSMALNEDARASSRHKSLMDVAARACLFALHMTELFPHLRCFRGANMPQPIVLPHMRAICLYLSDFVGAGTSWVLDEIMVLADNLYESPKNLACYTYGAEFAQAFLEEWEYYCEDGDVHY